MVKVKYSGAPLRAKVIYDMAVTEGWNAGAELGVLRGDTLKFLVGKGLHMVGVDTWRPATVMERLRNLGGRSYEQHDLEKYYADLVEWLGTDEADPNDTRLPKRRAQLMRMTTTKAAEMIAERTFDFVFIDADHTYEGVKADIAAWTSKVKPGGMVMGHDYNSVAFPSVIKAVDEAFPNRTLHDDHVWAARV